MSDTADTDEAPSDLGGPPLPTNGRAETLVDIPGKIKLKLTGGTIAGMLLMCVVVIAVFWKAGYTLAAPGSTQAGAITRDEAVVVVGEVAGKIVGDAKVAIAQERDDLLKEHLSVPHPDAAHKNDTASIHSEVEGVKLEQAAMRSQVQGVKEDVARIEAVQERKFDRVLDKLDGIRRDVRKTR